MLTLWPTCWRPTVALWCEAFGECVQASVGRWVACCLSPVPLYEPLLPPSPHPAGVVWRARGVAARGAPAAAACSAIGGGGSATTAPPGAPSKPGIPNDDGGGGAAAFRANGTAAAGGAASACAAAAAPAQGVAANATNGDGARNGDGAQGTVEENPRVL